MAVLSAAIVRLENSRGSISIDLLVMNRNHAAVAVRDVAAPPVEVDASDVEAVPPEGVHVRLNRGRRPVDARYVRQHHLHECEKVTKR